MSLARCALICALFTTIAHAQEGSVELPLAQYQLLTSGPRASCAFSDVRVRVDADESGADVTVTASAHVVGETFVPLPALGPIGSASVGGRAAALSARDGVVGWAGTAGDHALVWTYRTEARRSEGTRTITLALPIAAAELSAELPVEDASAVVLPSASLEIDGATIHARVPASGVASIAWHEQGGSSGHTLSRAHYRGRVEGDSVRFDAELTVDTNGPALVALVPSTIAIEDVSVDRHEAAIAVHEGSFAVPVENRGRHRVALTFRVPIARGDGLPRVELDLVPTPVARFELALPGDRQVNVEPHAGVVTSRARGETLATFHVPMSEHVAFEWAEAVPERAIETSAHASIVHAVRPDDGVLSIRAFATFEITRGALSRVSLELPPDVQPTTVVANGPALVSDWRADDGVLEVFLDREVSARLDLVITYERSWPTSTRTSAALAVPLLRARGAHRQRGMIALLSAGELTLEPRAEENVTRVGDNALPPEVHGAIAETIAHTFRYLDEPPRLVVIGAARPREPARFDARIDTLVSLGDVSTSVAILADLEIKSGALDTIALHLPENLNVLEVSAPSLRRYAVEDRTLRVELTQPMTGRLTIEVLAERITGEEEELELPFASAADAEIERGRIGVEALAPFQIDVARAARLSPIDPSELPERLRLRTDNPILHAYRYAQAERTPELSVRITRHANVSIPHASIEDASYRTLYTHDGLAVTNATLVVRNEREQFLRVRLPAGSSVWSARVNGREEPPAREHGSDEDEPVILLHVVSSAEPFTIELAYATPVPELGAFGRLFTELPAYDVAVARSRWELALPDGASYRTPDTSMTIEREGAALVLSQTYAGRDGEHPSVSIAYARGWGSALALALSLLGALLFWLGLLALAVVRLNLPLPAITRLPIATYRENRDVLAPLPIRKTSAITIAMSGAGALLLLLSHGWLATSVWPALGVSVLCALGVVGMIATHRRSARKNATDPAQSSV